MYYARLTLLAGASRRTRTTQIRRAPYFLKVYEQGSRPIGRFTSSGLRTYVAASLGDRLGPYRDDFRTALLNST